MSLNGSRRFSLGGAAGGGARVKVTLLRDGFNTPWGFRLAGGADLGLPLTVQRALAGTPSEGELKPGDVITKIGERDARHLSHKDAQNMIKNAGNTIVLQVERGGDVPKPVVAPMSPPLALQKPPPVQGAVPTPIAVVTNGGAAPAPMSPPAPVTQPLQVHTSSPAPSVAEAFSPRGANGLHTIASPQFGPQPAGHFTKTVQSPVQNLPVTTFPPPLPGFTPNAGQPLRPLTPSRAFGLDAPECIDLQPYRTTPLVLPGAKVKREVPTTSYLQHHPNPTMRASPQHYDPNLEMLMKQKVADTVLERVAGPDASKKVMHKQFNSPIGLYSEQNIADSVQSQTGVTPYKGKKTLYYDPAKSETFKALKDSELGDTVTEVPEPIQPKVFTPQRHIQPPINQMQRQGQTKSPQPPPENLLGDDKIHQSFSFRRLMNEVLGESEY